VGLVLALLATGALPAQSLRLFTGYGSHAILQRDTPIPVRGWAAPGASVTATFAGETRTTTADPVTGEWVTTFLARPANTTPQILTATSADASVTATNLLIGDVWLCSGQSNMRWRLSGSDSNDYQQELARPPQPLLRMFRTPDASEALTPQTDCGGRWWETHSGTVGLPEFCAVPYYFARRLVTETNVPIGLIVSAVGGTIIQAWMPEAAFDRQYPDDPQSGFLAIERADLLFQRQAIAAGRDPLTRAHSTSLYNGLIHPHVRTPIRGIVWYQGESSVGLGMKYHTCLRAMIETWRAAWNNPTLPFLLPTLASYDTQIELTDSARLDEDPNRPVKIAQIWEAQQRTLIVPRVGVTSILDVGEPLNVHPLKKKPVGERLAGLALQRVYGRNDLLVESPRVIAWKIDAAGALLTFDEVGAGLQANDGAELKWFSLAAATGPWVAAKASVIAPNQVRVASLLVPKPTRVRFAWNDIARPNLVNSAGLPALPWRSDATASEAAPVPTEDADDDGFSFVAEHAFGGDPTASDAAALAPASSVITWQGDSYLAIHFTRQIPPSGFRYQVQATASLLEPWSSLDIETLTVATTPLGNGYERVTVRDAAPQGSASAARFLRVVASGR
jgi:sialate O-acetylesterase